jgi:hypothetical protein
MRVPVLAFAAAAVLSPSLAAAQAMPMRKDGLWEMTMKMSSPMPMNMTMRQCTDPNEERNGAAFRNSGPPQGTTGVDCKPGPMGPVAGGWRYSQTCTMRGMTMTTTGVASGDFKSGYHIDSTTQMSPAPMPQMATQKMTIDAKWLGACPADMKPGDMIMNGRKISKAGR